MKKIALVTGASSGIGKETAKRLIKEGLTVYAAARRVELMCDLEEMGATVIKMDITREEDITSAVNAIHQRHGGVDVLVNNAGYGVFGAVEEITLQEARRQFEVNLFGLASLTQKVIPHMRARKSGTIVNVSSFVGKIYTPMGAWYNATKHALEAWSDCLRIELRQFGIDVVIIEPGIIKTEFDEVVCTPLAKNTAKSDYTPMAIRLAATMNKLYHAGKASSAAEVSEVITRSISSKRPHARYTVGYLANKMIFLRWLLNDRTFDKVSLSLLKA
jgi:short-subunit dehydrogenase